jgi:hypothetical protein
LEDVGGVDSPYHLERIALLVNVLASAGYVPLESHDVPVSVKCQGLWRYPEVENLLSEYSKTREKKWGIVEDGLTIKPLNSDIFSNEEFLEDLDVLVPYLAEQFSR